MYRYGKRIRKKYVIGFGVGFWYVVNQVTDLVVKDFKTREKARRCLRNIQKTI